MIDPDSLEQILEEIDAHDRRIEDLEGIEIPFQSTIESGGDGIPGEGRTLIEEINLSGEVTVTFSSIPQTFEHLELRYKVASNDDDLTHEMFLTINGLGAGGDYNWSRHELIVALGGGSDFHTVFGDDPGEITLGEIPDANDPEVSVREFTLGIAILPHYVKDNSYKGVFNRHLSFLASDFDNVEKQVTTGMVRETDEITELTLGLFAGETFATGSVAHLYGLD